MTPYQVLELIAEDIEPGTRSRVLCPKCGGGDSKETSLTLFRDHLKRIAWKCFRATCGYSGAPKGIEDAGARSKATPRYFTKPYVHVTRDDPEGMFLYERFGISLVNVSWCVDLRRYVLPCVGPSGNLRGVVAYGFDTIPKSLIFRERVDEPFIHYTYKASNTTTCVIVEDWFSAQKVGSIPGVRGVALLGTLLNRARIGEIKHANRGMQVILALDADAYGKAIKYTIEYGGEFDPPLKVWRLKSDLKYVSAERIKREINGGAGDFSSSNNGIKEGLR